MSVLESVVEKTYQALLTVVQTTALSRKVLQRPPFTFLHKLLVETLGDYDIFTYQQLEFAELVTKEDKAAFLTRAIAFVTFAMANINDKRISCLLLVSPIKVLAGVAVEDTHEFLLQLCEVCKSPDREVKDAAAQDVIAKGDAQLYTSGVTFRKGLLLVQAIVRSFIKRRVRKRKELQNGSRAFVSAVQLSMNVGTRFFKELADGRVYDGVIKEVSDKMYVLGYEQEPGARDEVDEIEMKIILEESQRLSLLKERMTTKDTAANDADILLTGLPDLSLPLTDLEPPPQLKPNLLMKRVSFQNSGIMLTLNRGKQPTVSQSQCFQMSPSVSIAIPSGEANRGSDRQEKVEPSLSRLSSGNDEAHKHTDPSLSATMSGDYSQQEEDVEEKPWQASLKKMLSKGQEPDAGMATPLANSLKKLSISTVETSSGDAWTPKSTSSMLPPSHLLTFPKFGIPGTKALAPIRKRPPNKAAASPVPKSLSKSKSHHFKGLAAPSNRQTPLVRATSSSSIPGGRGANTGAAAGGEHRVASTLTAADGLVDSAFGGQYQTTDQKTQEKLTLFREIVRRIDGYMKRKHLRVIDLFRFSDADGNGSISPQEMIDTLSQMEIQLSAEQAQDFLNYIDKDGNGSIDIDEFEELVRVARRNEAQREQLKKELNHTKKAPVESKPSGRFSAFVKHRQRICDEFKSADVGDVGALSVSQLRSILLRLDIPGVDEVLIEGFLSRALVAGSASSSSVTDASSSSTAPSGSATSALSPSSASAGATSGSSGMVYFHQLCRSLEDLEWTKKSNRFLDQSWISQFDSQMERAIREFELL